MAKRNEMIIVSLVGKVVIQNKKGVYNVQFAGVSDNPRKLMELQVWDMPHDTLEAATTTKESYEQRLKDGNGSFIIGLIKS